MGRRAVALAGLSRWLSARAGRLGARTMAGGLASGVGEGWVACAQVPGGSAWADHGRASVAHTPDDAATAEQPGPGRPQWQAVAPGVYLARGSGGVADAANGGRIGNAGLIVGSEGAVCIDTGSSRQHGEALLAAAAQLTRQPVRLALVTQVHPEFLFGGDAYQSRGIPVRMHARAARLMTARCEGCLRQLREQVGEAALRGTQLFTPAQLYSDSHVLTLIGRRLRVLYLGPASGPGDVAVLDEQTGSLFTGALAPVARVPDIQDADPQVWRQALLALQRQGVRHVLPGYGPPAGPAVLGDVQRYLDQLTARAKALQAAGESLMNVPDLLALPEFAHWDQYDTVHRRNASIAYLRAEREALLR